MSRSLCPLIALAALAACGTVAQRFPDDVAAALARDPMRRLETDHFILYYAAARHAEIERFLARAERCQSVTRAAAQIHAGEWADKMVVVMPDEPFNNAFVAPEAAGYESVAVIPTHSTLDFTTEFGLVADPGLIACHELTHYTHDQQIAGFWRYTNAIFGEIYDPQVGFDPWMFEGLATHYETALNPGVGRPTWPLFTQIFAAGYAGGAHLDGGELSAYKRLAAVGHHYLVGTMFVKFLADTYGEDKLWASIRVQAHAADGVFSATAIASGVGVRLGVLLEQFRAWTARTYPARARPAGQARLATVGNDARYARGRDGTEAWVADDVDVPAQLVVRDPDSREIARINLVQIAPPRLLVEAQPLLVSGLSVTADGREVWLTVVDTGGTYETTRLLRWRRGEAGLTEVQRELGPGAAIAPRGDLYYYCSVDGDRWSLAAYDVRANTRRVVHDMAPGTYITGARISPDGTRALADVYDGHRFVVWEIDVATGGILRELHGDGLAAVYDASYTSDGRALWLGEIAGRFQVLVEGAPVTDAPYTAFAPHEAAGTIRFLDREGWEWELAEVATPAPAPASVPPSELPTAGPLVIPRVTDIASDAPFSALEHLFYPQIRTPTLLVTSDNTYLGGVTVGGGDRLGQQRWSLTGYLQPSVRGDDHVHFGGDAQYLNLMLAPIGIYAEASQIDWGEPLTLDTGAKTTDIHRTRDAILSVSRTIRDSIALALAGVYTDDEQREAGFLPLVRHLAGPQLALAYTGAETTRYTGVRRALEAAVTVAYYPQDASSFASDITDVGGAVGGTVPLPWGRRHTLRLRVRGRALASAHETGLLQLGGDSGVGTIFTGDTAATTPGYDDSRFPPNLRFVEALRGYEDYAIATDRAGIADASYRYPIIIDRGAASVWRVLPSVFVRELDLEAFGAGAVDQYDDLHVAAGGAISLALDVWRSPLTIVYQVARRLRDDDAVVQLIGVLVQ